MSRQVDVKALISHIVRGDGADKCRICMGDTSEGQVYLGDTVIMDEDRPVTLSELLELVTGVEVLLDDDLPGGLCPTCSESAVSAATFQNFCRQVSEQWHNAVKILENIVPNTKIDNDKSLYAFLDTQDNNINLVHIKLEDIQYEQDYLSDESEEEIVLKKQKQFKVPSNICECPDCGKVFFNAMSFYEHLKDSTENKIPCFICATMMTREELVKHLKNEHKTRLYGCKKCPALLRTVNQLRRHLIKAHSTKAHFCGECGQSFKSAHALHGHTNLHLNKNCPSCDKLFRNRKCYTIHVKTCCNLDSSREDTYRTKNRVLYQVENLKINRKLKVGARGRANKECICDYCGKTYAGKKFVSAHIQIVHMKNTHRPCPYCGKSYAAAHMTEHIKKHENVATPFHCEHCGLVLKSRLGYIQHIRLHTGEKPYKCKFCSQSFSASSRRSEHIRNTHKSPDQIILKHCCNYCPAKFRLPYKLKKHIDNVHGENKTNEKGYECPECHIKFSSCRGLLHHSRKHQTFHLKSLSKDKATTEKVSN